MTTLQIWFRPRLAKATMCKQEKDLLTRTKEKEDFANELARKEKSLSFAKDWAAQLSVLLRQQYDLEAQLRAKIEGLLQPKPLAQEEKVDIDYRDAYVQLASVLGSCLYWRKGSKVGYHHKPGNAIGQITVHWLNNEVTIEVPHEIITDLATINRAWAFLLERPV